MPLVTSCEINRTYIKAKLDVDVAIAKLTANAQVGNVKSQTLLGEYLYRQKRDYKIAIKWLTKAETNGSEMARMYLLDYYKEYNKSFPILKRIAESGNPMAQEYLGNYL